MIFALVGNQNSGKTTLFNQLTGSSQQVGNFPGVTVEQKTGVMLGRRNASLVDLPGIYSLSPYTREEMVTRDFLLWQRPGGIINIADATNIERNLYLTLQLMELQLPMVLALNMMDEVRAGGGGIDLPSLRASLGIPVAPISAIHRQGLDYLVEQAFAAAENRRLPEINDFCTGAAHRSIHAVAHLIEDHCRRISVPCRFAAVKLIEGDPPLRDRLRLTDNENDMVEHAVREMETELATDREAALCDMRYQYIEEACRRCVVKAPDNPGYRRSVRFDSLLTHKVLALPLFAGLMLAIFWLTFGVIGNRLSDGMAWCVENAARVAGDGLAAYGLNPVAHSLVIQGLFTGVGAVLSFVPIILTLFFFLSLLEDSGYMARVAYMMDRPLRQLGLSGRSIVPLLMGFGCTVPAIMATRTLAGERDRRMTILLTPFMSCNAKLPIYALFTAAFFPDHQAWVMISLYLFGILSGLGAGFALKRTVYRGSPVPFLMELPNYRFPSPKNVLFVLWDRAKEFVKRVFTVILLATVAIWFLGSFDFRLNPVAGNADSMLAALGQGLGALFAPLGFGDWRVSTGLVTGFVAKESVISTLAVLQNAPVTELGEKLPALFTPLSAISFLVFTLLYTPCIAAIATVKREWGNIRGVAYMVFFQTAFAWLAAFAVYRIGLLVAGQPA